MAVVWTRIGRLARKHCRTHPASTRTPRTRAEGSQTSPLVSSDLVSAGTVVVLSPAEDVLFKMTLNI